METESNFTGIAEFASKGDNIALDEMFIGMFKAINKGIEKYTSSSKHPSKGWLEGCDDNPDNQTVDENDTETGTGNETEEVGSSTEILDSKTTY
jgi:hypothetical protein